MNKIHQAFLNQYLATIPLAEKEATPSINAEHFCADEYNANECARLINIGEKTASCSLKAGWAFDNAPLPQVGALTVVLNWAQEPVCIIRLTEVSICPFNEVSVAFAQAEGEGDGTYEWWYQAHVKFFTEYAESIGVSFTDTSDLVLERFEKVYPISNEPSNQRH